MENAQRAKTELADEIKPKLKTEKEKMDEIAMKNKNTKQSVEGIIRYAVLRRQIVDSKNLCKQGTTAKYVC